MDELLSQITSVARGLWRHRWLGVAVAWAAAVVGFVVVLAVPEKYEASARIFVDTQSILKPLMSGLAVQPNVEQQVSMLSRTLISRPNVEKLIRMADLDLGSKSKDAQESLIDSLMKGLEIKNVGRDNLYLLSFRDPSPEKAKRVVQSLVSIFVESSMGDSRKDSDAAKKFIDEQISNYVAKLQEAETRLKEFKVRNIELETGDGKDIVGQMGAITAQLSQARLELREAENARDAAKRQLDAEKARLAEAASHSLAQESTAAIATPEIDGRIDSQRRNLDALLQRFTEQHPDVVTSRRLIKELEEIKRKEVQELRKTALANPVAMLNNSPTYQEVSRVLATSEVQVASLRARVGEYDARLNRAKVLMKTAPQVEAELAQLNRDYDINKKNYNDLVSRRESATMSGNLESTAGVADFRLIDPPRASPKPAFVASQLRAVYYDPATIREVAGLPVLGVVSLIQSDAALQKERADLKRFLGVSAGLVGVFVAGMAVLSLLSAQAG